MNLSGIVSAAAMIILTGLGHIAVIQGHRHFGVKLWPVFLIIGVVSLALSFIVASVYLSIVLGIIAATFLWGIHELFKQRERVNQRTLSKGRVGN